jgi:hypothetical protein
MLNIQQRKALFGFATTSILLFSCRREMPLAPESTGTETFAPGGNRGKSQSVGGSTRKLSGIGA